MGNLVGLAAVLRNAGLQVVEVAGWKTRGHFDMGVIWGTVCHHTAGPATGETPSLGVVVNGRPGLSGPLCNLYLSRSGVWYVVAAGVAYHAGVVKLARQQNQNTIGVEAEGTGVSPWPAGQYASYAKGVQALKVAYGPVHYVEGHKEVCSPTGRKSDPNFDMNAFRAAVAAATTGGDDLSAQEVADINAHTDGVMENFFASLSHGMRPDNKTRNGTGIDQLFQQNVVLQAQVNALQVAVSTLASNDPDIPFDAAEFKAILERAATEAAQEALSNFHLALVETPPA